MLAYRISANPPHIELREVEEPVPSPDETLVRVRAFSLNRGEVVDLARGTEGEAVGWDVAGVAETGERVAGVVRRGAWAELVAVPTSQLAVIPDGVSDAEAAMLPTAGLTALRSLELGGLLLGKRVLVTGATGGVGRYAVQLAELAGASVTAVRVADGLADDFDLVVDAVGGATFAAAIEHLAPRGLVVNLAPAAPTRSSRSGQHGSIVARREDLHAESLRRASADGRGQKPRPPGRPAGSATADGTRRARSAVGGARPRDRGGSDPHDPRQSGSTRPLS